MTDERERVAEAIFVAEYGVDGSAAAEAVWRMKSGGVEILRERARKLADAALAALHSGTTPETQERTMSQEEAGPDNREAWEKDERVQSAIRAVNKRLTPTDCDDYDAQSLARLAVKVARSGTTDAAPTAQISSRSFELVRRIANGPRDANGKVLVPGSELLTVFAAFDSLYALLNARALPPAPDAASGTTPTAAQIEAMLSLMQNDHLFVGSERAFILAMNDVFAYACADGEVVEWSDLENLDAIAKREGWEGLVEWAAQRRGVRPIPPVEAKLAAARSSVPSPAPAGDTPCDHIWIAGPPPSTTGARQAFECTKCHTVKSEVV